jgi:hypothetical protein
LTISEDLPLICGRVQGFGPRLIGRCQDCFGDAGEAADCCFENLFLGIESQIRHVLHLGYTHSFLQHFLSKKTFAIFGHKMAIGPKKCAHNKTKKAQAWGSLEALSTDFRLAAF